MPHNTLRLQGGVIENETPVLNQAAIQTSNRIRFMYDPKGLSIPEKLGGWAKFYASQITAGIVRALWGWQDTNNNQWIAYAADSATATKLGAIQCTVNGSTGLTSATGTLQDITPDAFSTQGVVNFTTTAGTNLVGYFDFNAPGSITAQTTSVYITTPVSIAGIVLNGQYATNNPAASIVGNGVIIATDIIGNPAFPAYGNGTIGGPITAVSFSSGGGIAGIQPNKLTITYTASGATPFLVGDNVQVIVADNSITGSYIVLSSSVVGATGTVVVPTALSSYTFSTTGTVTNPGVTPIYWTTSGSDVIDVIFPNHGQAVGSQWTITNPTTVGGLTLYGNYTVQTVPQPYHFTIVSASNATASSHQYQNAITVTSGSHISTAETLNYATNIYTYGYGNSTPATGQHVLVSDIQSSSGNWNGTFTISSGSSGSISFTNSAVAGTYTSGGTFSQIGGTVGYIYSIGQILPPGLSNAFGATFWTLDSWGNDLIATPGNSVSINYPTHPLVYQPIYYWDATGGIQAQAIANGPPASNGAFVAMPQRQIVAWGSSFSGIIDPLLIRWSDVNNFNTWVAQTTNQAGSFRLASGAAIIGARQTTQQGLIWTDIELWSMQYISLPLVYGFNRIGQGCGLIGRYAHGILNGVVYWMGKNQFFMLSGYGVVMIPCPIWDTAFQDLDLVNVGKITCATNSMFQEITWYFPVKGGSGENSNYIKLNAQGIVAGQGPIWDYGTLDRSAWIDVSVLQQPIGFSPTNKFIYQHEISPDADGAAMGETFTTGWFSLVEGDQMAFVDQWWPDFKWGYFGQTQNANVTMTINGEDYPGQTVYPSYGPFTITQSTTHIDPRIRHRLVSLTVSGTGTGTWWRFGGMRYRFAPDGKY